MKLELKLSVPGHEETVQLEIPEEEFKDLKMLCLRWIMPALSVMKDQFREKLEAYL